MSGQGFGVRVRPVYLLKQELRTYSLLHTIQDRVMQEQTIKQLIFSTLSTVQYYKKIFNLEYTEERYFTYSINKSFTFIPVHKMRHT